MQRNNEPPKVFISYSWNNDDFVLNLANQLCNDGVDVVLDKWDLKEGQDKYTFMEKCVTDTSITKVLIIIDKEYKTKADTRTGGVGDETLIISSQVYGKTSEEKFIPIITEKDTNNEPYLPAYLNSKIYIDFSDENKYGKEYEKLIRNIYDKPSYVKPKIGDRPNWLDDDEKNNFYQLESLIHQIETSDNEERSKYYILKFQTEYIEALKKFFDNNPTPKKIYELFIDTKKIRDIFLNFIEKIHLILRENYTEVLAQFFEKIYNKLTCIYTFPNTIIAPNNIELFRIHIWELFICTIVFMRHFEDYSSINKILTRTYFLNTDIYGNDMKENNYTVFRYYSNVIEKQYKPESDMKNKCTIVGEIIYTQRSNLPIYTKEAIAEADLFLYQVCPAFNLVTNEKYFSDEWFPNLYPYTMKNNFNIKKYINNWHKMKSKSYCTKMLSLFGVNNIDDLKLTLTKCKHDDTYKYNNCFYSAPAILDCISTDDIGSIE